MISYELNKITDIQINNNIDTQNNKEIKEIYRGDKDLAILAILKYNTGYYVRITQSFNTLTTSFKIGAILDSIYYALEYRVKEVDKTYIKLSGTILKNILLNEVESNNTDKTVLNPTSNSYDDLAKRGRECFNLDSFDEFNGVELREVIMSSELSGIQKKIILEYVNSNCKVNTVDLAEQFGFSKQNVDYHLDEIRDKLRKYFY